MLSWKVLLEQKYFNICLPFLFSFFFRSFVTWRWKKQLSRAAIEKSLLEKLEKLFKAQLGRSFPQSIIRLVIQIVSSFFHHLFNQIPDYHLFFLLLSDSLTRMVERDGSSGLLGAQQRLRQLCSLFIWIFGENTDSSLSCLWSRSLRHLLAEAQMCAQSRLGSSCASVRQLRSERQLSRRSTLRLKARWSRWLWKWSRSLNFRHRRLE